MPSPGKEDRFRHDSASHGKCDSPPGIPLRPRQHGAGPAPCPSAATPFAGGSCPCPPGTHRYRASISGSIWGYYIPPPDICQQESEILGDLPAERTDPAGCPSTLTEESGAVGWTAFGKAVHGKTVRGWDGAFPGNFWWAGREMAGPFSHGAAIPVAAGRVSRLPSRASDPSSARAALRTSGSDRMAP